MTKIENEQDDAQRSRGDSRRGRFWTIGRTVLGVAIGQIVNWALRRFLD